MSRTLRAAAQLFVKMRRSKKKTKRTLKVVLDNCPLNQPRKPRKEKVRLCGSARRPGRLGKVRIAFQGKCQRSRFFNHF
jgi:hypothetical protein